MTRIVAVLALICLAAGCKRPHQGDGGSGTALPTLHQTLGGFHRPESCIFSLDGRFRDCMALSFTNQEDAAIEAGIEELAGLVESHRSRSTADRSSTGGQP